MQITDQTREGLREQFEPPAKTQIVHDLIREAIQEEEGITVTDEEVDQQIEEYMNKGGELSPETEERMREYWESQREGIEMSILGKKTMQLIVDHATITEVEPASEAAEQE